MPDGRTFKRLHRQLCETHSRQQIYVSRNEANRVTDVNSTSLKESIFNFIADTTESNTRYVVHSVSVSQPTVLRGLYKNLFHPFCFHQYKF